MYIHNNYTYTYINNNYTHTYIYINNSYTYIYLFININCGMAFSDIYSFVIYVHNALGYIDFHTWYEYIVSIKINAHMYLTIQKHK